MDLSGINDKLWGPLDALEEKGIRISSFLDKHNLPPAVPYVILALIIIGIAAFAFMSMQPASDEPICGDGLCTPPLETCETCQKDCGECGSESFPLTVSLGGDVDETVKVSLFDEDNNQVGGSIRSRKNEFTFPNVQSGRIYVEIETLSGKVQRSGSYDISPENSRIELTLPAGFFGGSSGTSTFGTISVTLEDSDGNPASATVKAMDAKTLQPADEKEMAGSGTLNVPGGEFYYVVAESPELGMQTTDGFHLKSGEDYPLTVTFSSSAPPISDDVTGKLEVCVRDEDGPVEEGFVGVFTSGGDKINEMDLNSCPLFRGMATSEGCLIFTLQAGLDVYAKITNSKAHCVALNVSDIITITPNETQHVKLELQCQGTAEIRVGVKAGGTFVTNQSDISVSHEGNPISGDFNLTSDQRYTIPIAVPSGEIKVEAEPTGELIQNYRSTSVREELGIGENKTITVELNTHEAGLRVTDVSGPSLTGFGYPVTMNFKVAETYGSSTTDLDNLTAEAVCTLNGNETNATFSNDYWSCTLEAPDDTHSEGTYNVEICGYKESLADCTDWPLDVSDIESDINIAVEMGSTWSENPPFEHKYMITQYNGSDYLPVTSLDDSTVELLFNDKVMDSTQLTATHENKYEYDNKELTVPYKGGYTMDISVQKNIDGALHVGSFTKPFTVTQESSLTFENTEISWKDKTEDSVFVNTNEEFPVITQLKLDGQTWNEPTVYLDDGVEQTELLWYDSDSFTGLRYTIALNQQYALMHTLSEEGKYVSALVLEEDGSVREEKTIYSIDTSEDASDSCPEQCEEIEDVRACKTDYDASVIDYAQMLACAERVLSRASRGLQIVPEITLMKKQDEMKVPFEITINGVSQPAGEGISASCYPEGDDTKTTDCTFEDKWICTMTPAWDDEEQLLFTIEAVVDDETEKADFTLPVTEHDVLDMELVSMNDLQLFGELKVKISYEGSEVRSLSSGTVTVFNQGSKIGEKSFDSTDKGYFNIDINHLLSASEARDIEIKATYIVPGVIDARGILSLNDIEYYAVSDLSSELLPELAEPTTTPAKLFKATVSPAVDILNSIDVEWRVEDETLSYPLSKSGGKYSNVELPVPGKEGIYTMKFLTNGREVAETKKLYVLEADNGICPNAPEDCADMDEARACMYDWKQGNADAQHVKTCMENVYVSHDLICPDSATVKFTVQGLATALMVIEDSKTDIFLVMDKSGSMKGSKIDQAKDAAKTFVDALSHSGARIGLVTYGSGASVNQQLTTDYGALVQQIENFGIGGRTYIGTGINTATNNYGSTDNEKFMIVLSDGRKNGGACPYGAAANAKNNDIEIYSLAFGGGADTNLMRAISSDPSTHYFAPGTGEGELRQAFSRIAVSIIIEAVSASTSLKSKSVSHSEIITDNDHIKLFEGSSLRPEMPEDSENVLYKFGQIRGATYFPYWESVKDMALWGSPEEAIYKLHSYGGILGHGETETDLTDYDVDTGGMAVDIELTKKDEAYILTKDGALYNANSQELAAPDIENAVDFEFIPGSTDEGYALGSDGTLAPFGDLKDDNDDENPPEDSIDTGVSNAADLEFHPNGRCYYVLDKKGKIHAKALSGSSCSINGFDNPITGPSSVDMELKTEGDEITGVVVLNEEGGVRASGAASGYDFDFGWPAATDIEFSDSGDYYVLDVYGGIHSAGNVHIKPGYVGAILDPETADLYLYTHCTEDCRGDVTGDYFTGGTRTDEDDLDKYEGILTQNIHGGQPYFGDFMCADVNNDLHLSDEDYNCIQNVITNNGDWDSCSKCDYEGKLEVCNDGEDNNCDGQTDSEHFYLDEDYLYKIYYDRISPYTLRQDLFTGQDPTKDGDFWEISIPLPGVYENLVFSLWNVNSNGVEVDYANSMAYEVLQDCLPCYNSQLDDPCQNRDQCPIAYDPNSNCVEDLFYECKKILRVDAAEKVVQNYDPYERQLRGLCFYRGEGECNPYTPCQMSLNDDHCRSVITNVMIENWEWYADDTIQGFCNPGNEGAILLCESGGPTCRDGNWQ